TQCFPPVIERLLHHLYEALFVAFQRNATVACETHHGRHNPRRWEEHARRHFKQHLYMIKRLQQHTQDAIGLAPMRRCKPVGHLALYHSDYLAYTVAVFQHLKKNLRGDIIGKVADDWKGAGYARVKVGLQQVALDQPRPEGREVFAKKRHRFAVDLDDKQLHARQLQQVTGKDAWACADFQYR